VRFSNKEVDKLTVSEALTVRAQQNKMHKSGAMNRYLPGEMVAKLLVVRGVEQVLTGEDDRVDKIHMARFLRMPEKQSVWWKLTSKVWAQEFEQKINDVFGTWSTLVPLVFHACHNRGYAMELKHFLCKNFSISGRATKPVLSANDGTFELDGHSKDYYLLVNIIGCVSAVTVLAAVNRELWPWDPNTDVMNRVLLAYNYFSTINNEKVWVRAFTAWFNQVLHTNATKSSEHPMGYKPMEKLAKDVLQQL
jgi:hypothetical protein